ncbi:integrase [Streptomyces sp. NPDC047315]|uniref:integrase n=1 Tax=Streptomyces sp. NPDC047315 TaxID=3155142 RepID=UPI0033D7E7A8
MTPSRPEPVEEEIVDGEEVADWLPAIAAPRGWLPTITARGTVAALGDDDGEDEEPDPDAWLPPEAEEDVRAGIPDSTEQAYGGDMLRFAQWCVTVGRRSMPAAPQTVTAYLSYLKRTPREETGLPYSPRSMDRVIASIRSSHRAAGFKPPDTMGARKVVRGYRAKLSKDLDPRAEPRKASPVDREVLAEALAALDRTTLVGKRDAALLLLGHALFSRGSELVPLNWPKSFTRLPEGGLRVRVYRKKAKMWQKVKVPLDPDPDLCAVRAVRALARALAKELAGEGRTEYPLFQRIDRYGYLAPPMTRHGKPIGDPTGRMTEDAASDLVERAIRRTGRAGKWTTHSLRRGGVKSARAAGADIVDIGRHGGWKDGSKALIGYIDEEDSQGARNPLAKIAEAAQKQAERKGRQ